MFIPDVSLPICRTAIDSNGKEWKVFGFCLEGVCATCDSFFPYGPQHSTRHRNHCSCNGCF